MERKIPKNVRQIGNVSDSLKIYVEDYVDTYLNQLCEKEAEAPVGAFLIGEIVKEDDLEYQYVYGAVQMKDLGQDANGIIVDEDTWKDSCEMCKAFFGDGRIIGWFAAIPGIPFAMNSNLKRVHHKLFSRDSGIFILKDPVCKDEMYFAPKFNELMQMNGHYIYYEKNPSMQNYMISSRKKIGVTPSEVVADRAAKSFRNLVQNKMVQQEKKQISKWTYGASVFLVMIVLITGITAINNYDRMRSMQSAMEAISNSMAGKEEVQAKETEEPEQEEEKREEIPEADDVEEPAVSEEEDSHRYDNGMYIVEKGDTLEAISRKAYGDTKHIEAISRMNGLENGDLIYIGQKLLLP